MGQRLFSSKREDTPEVKKKKKKGTKIRKMIQIFFSKRVLYHLPFQSLQMITINSGISLTFLAVDPYAFQIDKIYIYLLHCMMFLGHF